MSVNTKTTLIYFGDINNSKYGTIRGFIAFFLLIPVFLLTMKIAPTFYNQMINDRTGLFIGMVVIVSALCVHVPHDIYDALKYGASVGFCLSTIAVIARTEKMNSMKTIVFVLTSTKILSLLSVITYLISKEYNLYPTLPCID